MSDEEGRARRKELELLQGRLKQAQLELELAHSEGYLETLKDLFERSRQAEGDAAVREHEARELAQRLARVRHDVAEAERQLLAPAVLYTVSPAMIPLTLGSLAGGAFVMATLLLEGPSFGGWLVLGALVALPPPVLAWILRRRLSGGGTFRTPS